MNVFLMYPDKDFDLERPLPPNHQDLTQDLGLDRLFSAMAQDDPFVRKVAQTAVFTSLTNPDEIIFRQHVLQDCIAHPGVVRQLYAIALDAIGQERKIYRSFLNYPDAVLRRAVEVLELFVEQLRKLRSIADEVSDVFESEGFRTFFAMIQHELSDEYFAVVDQHLKRLHFKRGVLISARLGQGNRGVDFVLREPRERKRSWRDLFGFGKDSALTLEIAERDESGARALSELRGRGLNTTADVVAKSADHILGFFRMLSAELAFYLGCLNLRDQLISHDEPVSFPRPAPRGAVVHSAGELYDVSLCLALKQRVVGNDLRADGKRLIVITGANQGGKSTFLRGVGLAQLMMQCGMFVAAEAYTASVSSGLYTHFRREEDPTMQSGKLDEELSRMDRIVARIKPHAMMLFNESFSATNEREGAEIAAGIVDALLDAGIEVFFVTHSFELSHGFYERGLDHALFLRAQRQEGGRRTYRLEKGEPLPTSFGVDLYGRIFNDNVLSPHVREGHPPPRRTDLAADSSASDTDFG
jgi:hypothetical protein